MIIRYCQYIGYSWELDSPAADNYKGHKRTTQNRVAKELNLDLRRDDGCSRDFISYWLRGDAKTIKEFLDWSAKTPELPCIEYDLVSDDEDISGLGWYANVLSRNRYILPAFLKCDLFEGVYNA